MPERAPRVTMNEKRARAIYAAATGPILDARIAVRKVLAGRPRLSEEVDELLFTAQQQAGSDALTAAGVKRA